MADDLVHYDPTTLGEVPWNGTGAGRVTILERDAEVLEGRADALVKLDEDGEEVAWDVTGAGRVTLLEKDAEVLEGRANNLVKLDTNGEEVAWDDTSGDAGRVTLLERDAEVLGGRANSLVNLDEISGEEIQEGDSLGRPAGRVTLLENNKLNKNDGQATGLTVTGLSGTATNLRITGDAIVSYLYIGPRWRIKANSDGSQLEFEWASVPISSDPASAIWQTAIPFVSTSV